jgi:diguanylate cyclase (GGDEF)-like protein
MENCSTSPRPQAAENGQADWQVRTEKLVQENLALQQKLQQVLETASANETIWRRFLEIERLLFSVHEFDRLVHELPREIKNRFQLDWVLLYLIHPDVLERFFPTLDQHGKALGEGTWLLPVHLKPLTGLFAELRQPVLFQLEDAEICQCLPAQAQQEIRSGVWVPITIYEMTYGALLLGSHDEQRYQPDVSTDLLEQLGIKIALCMDNCLIYEQLKDLMLLDSLTGLPNLSQVQVRLEREFRKARRREGDLAVALVDLDFFQQMNENFGHPAAAAVLEHVAGLLQGLCREHDILGRSGSNQFIFVFPATGLEEAESVLAEAQQLLRKSPFNYQNAAILLQASVGVAALKETMERSQDLLNAAFADLYRAKLGLPVTSTC